MSFSETVFLFVLALVIFGPKKLPEIARMVGKYMNEFRRASNEFKAQIDQEIRNLEIADVKRTILEPSPTPQGTANRTLTAASEAPAAEVANPPAIPVPTQASPEDEPLFAAPVNGSAAGNGPAAVAETVPPSSSSQESHA